MNHVPLSPSKGGTKRDFAFFSSKIQILSKKSATQFLCMKSSSSRVVATSFLYLTVHRWIAGDVPIYLIFVLNVIHPFRKRRFRQILLNRKGKGKDRGVVRSFDPLIMFGASVISLERLNLKSSNFVHSNRMTYHQQKGRGYGHVNVLKFCRLS